MKVRELIEGYLNDILGLHPTDTEITAFRKSLINDHGIITAGDGRTDLRLPFIHETWRKKWGGRTHIDMGDSNGQIPFNA
ncbi:MAG: hypothetical protein MPEBLZ_02060 [Candidatus Methanoperedens nitroreducens]|uniref:Uncharacterized protein n=1 Tax=Candidatus Methanoperedens nitratireducens TaxID=1392998 RepID=A0A0N8KQY0_9EURY|nr:MAG: hypothetical protein MPEBLZ_02060 [Candidatus Methanoperedens sp. BLZ1]